MIHHRLSDPDAGLWFDFKIGDRVCFAPHGSTPDLDQCGTVVDGVWEGAEVHGVYDIVYMVRGKEGQMFNVSHHQLVRDPRV